MSQNQSGGVVFVGFRTYSSYNMLEYGIGSLVGESYVRHRPSHAQRTEAHPRSPRSLTEPRVRQEKNPHSYIFVKQFHENNQTFVWYQRDKNERKNILIPERDLTGLISNAWRYDRTDEATGQGIPRLNIAIHADKDYVVQTGFHTNFSKTFLSALLELNKAALEEPVTLVVETNEGSRHRPTLFCRLEWRGKRMTPELSKDPEELYEQAVERFGFSNPYAPGETP